MLLNAFCINPFSSGTRSSAPLVPFFLLGGTRRRRQRREGRWRERGGAGGAVGGALGHCLSLGQAPARPGLPARRPRSRWQQPGTWLGRGARRPSTSRLPRRPRHKCGPPLLRVFGISVIAKRQKQAPQVAKDRFFNLFGLREEQQRERWRAQARARQRVLRKGHSPAPPPWVAMTCGHVAVSGGAICVAPIGPPPAPLLVYHTPPPPGARLPRLLCPPGLASPAASSPRPLAPPPPTPPLSSSTPPPCPAAGALLQ